MAIADVNGDHVTVVELVSNSSSSSSNSLIIDTISSSSSSSSSTTAALNLNLNLNDEIIPLLTEQDKHKINIFTISYSRTKPPNKEKGMKVLETDVSLLPQFISWTWGGSKYSGLLCMIISSTIYSIMEVFSYTFAVGRIPLFETIFTRCAVIMFSSFVWLRRTRQPIFGPPHVRSLLVSRALVGYLSLFSFAYSIQSLPLPQAILFNLMTPLMASLAARFILQETLKLADIGGLICSFLGVLFILLPQLASPGKLVKEGIPNNKNTAQGIHSILAVLIGLFSSITGGVSYCLIRAVAKASDQPVITVFSFSLFACPAAAVCTFALQDFVLPDIGSFLLMVILGVLAFFAEVLLARGLQLEKTNRVTNMHYIEPFLSEIWRIALSRLTLSIGGLFGSLLILVSACSTLFFGPEKEMDRDII